MYRTAFVQFHYEPAATLETEWLDFANSEQLRTALTKTLRLGRQPRVRSWVDSKQMGIIWPPTKSG